MNIHTPYTYRITSKTTGQHYYGVRFARGCHPNDLWVSYFTSSKYVKELIEQYGKDDFIVEIRKTFIKPNEAIEYESRVLQSLDVVNNDSWLNKHDTKTTNIHKSNTWLLTSPTGKINIIENLNNFCITNKLNQRNLSSVSLGLLRHSKGWVCENLSESYSLRLKHRIMRSKIGIEKKWIITTPNGDIMTITNLSKFCKDNDLNYKNMHRISKGLMNYHKGYSCKLISAIALSLGESSNPQPLTVSFL